MNQDSCGDITYQVVTSVGGRNSFDEQKRQQQPLQNQNQKTDKQYEANKEKYLDFQQNLQQKVMGGLIVGEFENQDGRLVDCKLAPKNQENQNEEQEFAGNYYQMPTDVDDDTAEHIDQEEQEVQRQQHSEEETFDAQETQNYSQKGDVEDTGQEFNHPQYQQQESALEQTMLEGQEAEGEPRSETESEVSENQRGDYLEAAREDNLRHDSQVQPHQLLSDKNSDLENVDSKLHLPFVRHPNQNMYTHGSDSGTNPDHGHDQSHQKTEQSQFQNLDQQSRTQDRRIQGVGVGEYEYGVEQFGSTANGRDVQQEIAHFSADSTSQENAGNLAPNMHHLNNQTSAEIDQTDETPLSNNDNEEEEDSQDNNLTSIAAPQQFNAYHQPEIRRPSSNQNVVHQIEYTEVFVWGDHRQGQLGIDSQLQASNASTQNFNLADFIRMPRSCSFNIIISQVACGEEHSGIVTSAGHLYMMGSNRVGQLGVRSIAPSASNRNDPSQAGSPCLVEALKMTSVISVACGKDFTIAITESSSTAAQSQIQSPQNNFESKNTPLNQPQQRPQVYAWGNNESGQLGVQGVESTCDPIRIDAFDVLDEDIVAVSCGKSHSLFLTSESDVISCGNNMSGECGFDPTECSATAVPFKVAAFDGVGICQVSAGETHSLFLSQNGEIFASGNNEQLQLGVGNEIRCTQTPVLVQAVSYWKIKQVAAGAHSACVTVDGELFLWGVGSFGEFAYPQKILTISSPVADISIGGSVSTAIDLNGTAWSWGQNGCGELGVGDMEPRKHPFPVLNLKGKHIQSVKCGSNFTICLGNEIRKAIGGVPQIQQVPNINAPEITQPSKVQKKKSGKRKKSQERSRPKSSTLAAGFKSSDRDMQILKKSRVSRQMPDASKLQTFGINSRQSSQERVNLPTNQARKAFKKPSTSNRDQSNDRVLSNLQMKYGGVSRTNISQTQDGRTTDASRLSRPSHQKTETSNNKTSTAMIHGAEIQREQAVLIEELKVQVKSQKHQIKLLKEDNKTLRGEGYAKNQVIDKLEKDVAYLRTEPESKIIIKDLQSDLKRNEMKLRKMKERRNQYREVKESMQEKFEEVQKDNETLVQQISEIQEMSHNKRSENANLKAQLVAAEERTYALERKLESAKSNELKAKDERDRIESDLTKQLNRVVSRQEELFERKRFEADFKSELEMKIKELEKQVSGREDYMQSLEKEAIMLRHEIKNAKFNKEKGGYDKFLSGLTTLRPQKQRSVNSRARLNDSTISQERAPSRHQRDISQDRLQQQQQVDGTSSMNNRSTPFYYEPTKSFYDPQQKSEFYEKRSISPKPQERLEPASFQQALTQQQMPLLKQESKEEEMFVQQKQQVQAPAMVLTAMQSLHDGDREDDPQVVEYGNQTDTQNKAAYSDNDVVNGDAAAPLNQQHDMFTPIASVTPRDLPVYPLEFDNQPTNQHRQQDQDSDQCDLSPEKLDKEEKFDGEKEPTEMQESDQMMRHIVPDKQIQKPQAETTMTFSELEPLNNQQLDYSQATPIAKPAKDSIQRENEQNTSIMTTETASNNIPTGAVDLRDKYKEMLMRKLDSKMIKQRLAGKR